MKRFIEIDGHIISVAAIALVFPPRDGKTLIQFVNGNEKDFPEEYWGKLRGIVSGDCIVLS